MTGNRRVSAGEAPGADRAVGGTTHPFGMRLLRPSCERLGADVDEALVMGAGAFDEELLALRPAVEVPHKLGVAVG